MSSLKKKTTATGLHWWGLRLGAPNEGDMVLIPVWGTKTPHATRCGLKQNKTKNPHNLKMLKKKIKSKQTNKT